MSQAEQDLIKAMDAAVTQIDRATRVMRILTVVLWVVIAAMAARLVWRALA